MTVDFTAHRNPNLAVLCPTCRAGTGVMCRRPSGHRAAELHAERRVEANRVFIALHGEQASISSESGHWIIDPVGRKPS